MTTTETRGAFVPDLTLIAAGEPLGTPFTLLLCVEGYETSDGRMFELGESTWREPPIPFMCQDTTAHGPGQIPAPAWAAGQIEEIWRDPADASRIIGRGHYMANEQGRYAEQLARGAFRGVSVDAYGRGVLPPGQQATHVDETGDPLAVLIRYSDNVITRVTQVPTQALEPCRVWFDDEEEPDITRMAHGAVIAPDAEPQVVMTNSNAFEQMVAAGGGPLHPERLWFFTPEPDHYQPIEVTPDGHWTGHIAREGQCYLGGLACRTAPPSQSTPPYKGFHRTVAHCKDGTEVACGFATMATKHAPDLHGLQPGQVADQYDHTGTIGAKIRCSNGKHGVWSSGAILPGLQDRELAILQGPEVSGDWRSWTDPDTGQQCPLELLGVLAVPFPAFPGTRTRPELLVASGGTIIGQRGQIMPCADEGEPMTPEETERVAALEAKVERLEQINAALIAAASPEVAASIGEAFGAGVAQGVKEGADAIAAAAHAFVDENGDGKCDTCGMPEAMHKNMGAAADSDEIAAANGEGDVTLTDTSAMIPVDMTIPLSAAEQASYFARYVGDPLEAMVRDGRAMSDGTFAIGDVDDLCHAIRAMAAGGAGPADRQIRTHAMRAAARLEHPELIPRTWRADGTLAKR